MSANAPEPLANLLKSLSREFFQTESSAVLHCTREADRLGSSPAAEPLRAIARHAQTALKSFAPLAKAHDLPVSGGGLMVGALFSELRDRFFDKTIRSERSYRGTMLGVKHGLDLVRLLSATADAAGYLDLVAFCHSWLQQREPSIHSAEETLTWFALHPEDAMRMARPLFAI
jgi:hypothetical protein